MGDEARADEGLLDGARVRADEDSPAPQASRPFGGPAGAEIREAEAGSLFLDSPGIGRGEGAAGQQAREVSNT